MALALTKRCSALAEGDRCAASDTTPCLGNSPSATSIWQRPHNPRPPHTESMSTPSARPACSSGVPSAKRPRPETDIGGAAGGVHLQLAPQTVQQPHDLPARLADGADGHDQRINDDIAGGNTVIRRAVYDLAGDLKAHVGVLRDAGFIVADSDDGRPVFLHQRQHGLEPLLLAGHRVNERLAAVYLEAGFQRRDDRGVD